MTKKILIVDDEPRYLRLMEANLLPEGYEVIKAENGQGAIESVLANYPDLVLLDVMMPELDGFAVLERLREFSTIPVIIITARGNEGDRVKGLDLGSDDYIVKPFSAVEMLARVRAVFRRVESNLVDVKETAFSHGNLRIDFARAEVHKGDRLVYLSATEYRLLLQFAHNVGSVLTMEQLLTDVWGLEYKDEKEILWVSISRLRQKVEDDPRTPEHIQTRAGIGYIMPA